jgi:hypothetical protein
MSNTRLALAVVMLLMGILQGCGGDDAAPKATIPLAAERTNYPFSTAEPEVYSARVVIASGGKAQEHFIARNGERSRTDIDVGTPAHTSRIIDPAREVVINYATKIYYEVPRGDGETADLGESRATIRGLFASGLPAKFESAGSENGLAKYSVKLSGEDTASSFVFFDEKAGMVVKQEMYSSDGGVLLYSTELIDLKLEAEDSLFAIPAGFKKVNAPN